MVLGMSRNSRIKKKILFSGFGIKPLRLMKEREISVRESFHMPGCLRFPKSNSFRGVGSPQECVRSDTFSSVTCW